MNIVQLIQDFFAIEPSQPEEGSIVDGRIVGSFPAPGRRRAASASTCMAGKNVILSLDDLLRHPDFDIKLLAEGRIPLGIIQKTGALLQTSWEDMVTAIVAGLRRHGKSSILKSLVLYALHARKLGFKCKIYLFDPHHNLPDALGTFLKPILHQFDACFLGEESFQEGEHLTLFETLESQIKHYQKHGFDNHAPWHLFFVDEADRLFKAKNGKITYQQIETFINLRKARIFLVLSFADTTKSGSGGHGTGLVAAGSTAFCVPYDVDRARRILPKEDAYKAEKLSVGEAIIKLPDETHTSLCRMPLVTNDDLKPFLKAA